MKYRNRTTGIIYTDTELRLQYSHISFPVNWDNTTLDFLNVDPVIETAPFSVGCCEKPVYLGVSLLDGKWVEQWTTGSLYEDPTEQALCLAECLDTQWGIVRAQRDSLLTLTDYTQLVDTPITTECRANFQTYRQALRDITLQSDPNNITWPVMPVYEKIP